MSSSMTTEPGLLGVYSAGEVRAMELDEERRKRKESDSPTLQAIAKHITEAFEAAKQHRDDKRLTNDLNTCQRLRAGEYEPDTLAEIQRQGGSETFFNITETKCASLEAWLQDIMSGFPFKLEPTPVPDLPEEIKQGIVQEAVAAFMNARAMGAPMDPAIVQEITLRLYDEAERREQQKAKEIAEKQQKIIEDQLVEGSWREAINGALNHLSTYRFGALKGPVLQIRKKLTWQNGEPVVEEEPIPTWQHISSHDLFFGPSATSSNDSYICELVRFDKGDLIRLKGVDGYNAENIELALRDKSSSEFMLDNSSRSDIEKRAVDKYSTVTNAPDQLIEGIEYWGGMEGSALLEWGMDGDIDPDDWYEITAVLVGDYVIRAILNPDPLGRRPYFHTSVEKYPGTPHGNALPLMMKYCQDGVNAATRAMVNNLALSSGPQVSVDLDATEPGTDVKSVFPWKIWPFRSGKLAGRVSVNPVQFFHTPSNVSELMNVSEYFKTEADDATRVPRYAYGNDQVSGAGETASGLSMLMNAASKGIKRVVGFVDNDLIAPAIQMLHAWNMLYRPDYPKGDACIIPRGALANMIREQVSVRRQEFLAATNNPTDMAIVGIEGRAAVLRETVKELDMPADDIVPPVEVLRARTEAMMQQQAMEQQEPVEEPAE